MSSHGAPCRVERDRQYYEAMKQKLEGWIDTKELTLLRQVEKLRRVEYAGESVLKKLLIDHSTPEDRKECLTNIVCHENIWEAFSVTEVANGNGQSSVGEASLGHGSTCFCGRCSQSNKGDNKKSSMVLSKKPLDDKSPMISIYLRYLQEVPAAAVPAFVTLHDIAT